MKNLLVFIYGSRKKQLLFAIFLWASIFLAVIAAGKRYIRPKATGGPIALSFAVLPSPLQSGGDFDLIVAANPNGLSFNAFELHFTFDDKKVELKNPTNPAGNFEKPFSSDLGITQTVTGNKIVVSGAKTGAPFSGNKNVDLVKVKMKVKAEATGSANFVWDEKTEVEGKSLTKTNGEFPLGGVKGAKLYFASEKTSYNRGENLNLKLYLNTAKAQVNSVQFEFNYDDTALTFQKDSSDLAADNIELSSTSGFDVNNPLNTIDTRKRIIRIGLVTTSQVSGTKELATVKLKVKEVKEATTAVRVSFSANDNSKVYDLQTKNILTEKPIYSISIGKVVPTVSPSVTPKIAQCNQTCSPSSPRCTQGLKCYQYKCIDTTCTESLCEDIDKCLGAGRCRNPACPEREDCLCGPTPTPPKEATIPIGKKASLVIVIGPQTDASQIRFAAKLAHVQTTPEMYFRLRLKDELAFKDIILGQGETTDEGETPEDTCNTPGFDEFEFWVPMKADDNGIYTPATSISPVPPAGKIPAVVSDDGWVTLTGLKPGRYYTFYLKAPKTRRTQMVQHFVLEKGAPISQDFDWSSNLLAPGDLPDPNNNANQDCCVNSVDISLIWGRHAACCNASCDRKNDSSCPDWDKMVVADVNYDGFIDGNDISKVVDTLSTKPDDD